MARPSRSGSTRRPVGVWSRSSGPRCEWSGENVVLLCLRDLTERRRFELANGREARFRSLVHNAGSVIMLVSSEGILESVSGAITRLLGHDPELLEQRPLVEHRRRERPRRVRRRPGRRLAAGRLRGTRSPPGRPAAPRRCRHGPVRTEHREPVGRPDRRGSRDLRPRRHGAGVRRDRARRGPVAPHRHARFHGGRDPGGRRGGEDHQRQPALRRDLAAPRRGPGHQGRSACAGLRPRSDGPPRGLRGQGGGALRPARDRELRHPRVQGRPRGRASFETPAGGRRNGGAGVELPRRHRPQAPGRGAGLPGLPRLPDGTRQQGTLPGPAGPRPGAHRADQVAPGRALPRSGRLQDGQRQPGARRRGPPPAAGGDHPGRVSGRLGHGGPLGRRRVRGPDRRRAVPERDHGTGPAHPRCAATARPARDQVRQLGGQHRHRVQRGRHDQRAAPPQRRHRHVQGQGPRQGPLRDLPRRDVRLGAGTPRTGGGAAGRDRRG